MNSKNELSKEDIELINSMTSLELFNFIDTRLRDMYQKNILPTPNQVRRNTNFIFKSYGIFFITLAGIMLNSSHLFFPTLFVGGILLLLLFKFDEKRNNQSKNLFDQKRILKIVDFEHNMGLSFYLSKEYDLIMKGSLE